MPGPAATAEWGAEPPLTGSADVSKIAVASSGPGVYGPFYLANFNARAFLQSPDGATWNNRSAGLPDRYISDIEYNPTAPEQVWVTVKGFGTPHVLFSPDGGVTWQDRSGDLPDISTNDILLDPLDVTNAWYVATDIGVYGTTDGGLHWSVIGSNL